MFRPIEERLTIDDLAFLAGLKIAQPSIHARPVQRIHGFDLVNEGRAQCPNCGRETIGLYLDGELADSYEAPNCGIACKACHLRRKGSLRLDNRGR